MQVVYVVGTDALYLLPPCTTRKRLHRFDNSLSCGEVESVEQVPDQYDGENQAAQLGVEAEGYHEGHEHHVHHLPELERQLRSNERRENIKRNGHC